MSTTKTRRIKGTGIKATDDVFITGRTTGTKKEKQKRGKERRKRQTKGTKKKKNRKHVNQEDYQSSKDKASQTEQVPESPAVTHTGNVPCSYMFWATWFLLFFRLSFPFFFVFLSVVYILCNRFFQ